MASRTATALAVVAAVIALVQAATLSTESTTPPPAADSQQPPAEGEVEGGVGARRFHLQRPSLTRDPPFTSSFGDVRFPDFGDFGIAPARPTFSAPWPTSRPFGSNPSGFGFDERPTRRPFGSNLDSVLGLNERPTRRPTTSNLDSDFGLNERPTRRPTASYEDSDERPTRRPTQRPARPTQTQRPTRPTQTQRPSRPSASGASLINPEQCGYLADDRIIGGNSTVVMELPWMVRLGYGSTARPSFNCGGSLINSRYVLTAAHCVGGGEDPVMVRLGEHDSQRNEDCSTISGAKVCAPPVVDVDVEKVIRHDGFSSNTLMNDIALLRLAQPVEFTDAVKPICLPTGRVSFSRLEGKNGAVAGWGKGMNQAVRGTRYLMKAKVPFTSFSSCEREYSKRGIELNEQSQVCAGGKPGVDSCQGDSGGPLYGADELAGRSGPSIVQFGVVSFGLQKCAVAGVPGIYTRVDHYLPWITSNMQP